MAAAHAAAGDGGELRLWELDPFWSCPWCSQPSLSEELGWHCRRSRGLLSLRDYTPPSCFTRKQGYLSHLFPAAGVRITLHGSLASQEAHAVRGATHLPRQTGSWAGGVCGHAGKPDRSRIDWSSRRKREQEASTVCLLFIRMGWQKRGRPSQLNPKEGDNPSWVRWRVPIIPKLSKPRQENHESRPTWVT